VLLIDDETKTCIEKIHKVCRKKMNFKKQMSGNKLGM
jgi:hypothetical protein